ncbi:MAG: methyltransferase domain-containing protein [Candidatus Hodarchaeales archaeon]
MNLLEKKPDNYESEFEKLFPESRQIYKSIVDRIDNTGKVLEIGSGTGQLAVKLAKKGLKVYAVDISEDMIEYAKKKAISNDVEIKFIVGDFTSYEIFNKIKIEEPFDCIISTFALSEMSSLKQLLFLKQVYELLSPEGQFFIAADTVPSSMFRRLLFKFNFSIKLGLNFIRGIPTTNPVENLDIKLNKYFTFSLLFSKKNIELYQCQRIDKVLKTKETLEEQLGRWRRIKKLYCIINGIMTKKSIKPGFYQIGSPNKASPIIVTGNYYWTVYDVYTKLKRSNIDCHLLIVDSKGINVWCAAGGKHFTHTQIIDSVRLFDVDELTSHKNLILPQLSATGVDRKEITKFGWKPEFGPVLIKHIDNYLKTGKKDEVQSSVSFNLKFRTLMGLQHTFFLVFVYLFPLLILTAIIGLIGVDPTMFWFFTLFQVAIISIVQSMVFACFYPVFDFTQSFFLKGVSFGGLSSVAIVFIFEMLGKKYNFETIIFWIILLSLIGLLISLDFAGHSPYTNHLDVEADLILFMIPGSIMSFLLVVIAYTLRSISLLI